MRALIAVQCRCDSRRLPYKALYPIGGVPLLVFLLRRLKAGLPAGEYGLALACPELEQDRILSAWAAEEEVEVVRGDRDDLIKRYLRCLDRFGATIVVRVTGDNPLTCPVMIRALVRACEDGAADYGQFDDLPYGAGADAYSAAVLRRLDRSDLLPDEREHINLHILRHPERFRVVRLPAPPGLSRPDVRLTVDTAEDHERVCAVVDKTARPWMLGLEDAIARMDRLSLR